MENPRPDPGEILEEALRLPASERGAYLASACAGAPELLDDLRGLLDVHERYPSALALPASIEAAGPPQRLGPYAIEREIGRGGMGVVYLALDPRLGREIAIKLLPGSLAESPELRERFVREARLLAALNHPGIATIHSLEEAGGAHFLTMEHIEGETLADRLARGPLDPAAAVSIVSQIARALEAAHAKGIIHRDLKPGNVMVLGEDRVKVLDFGLAVEMLEVGGPVADSSVGMVLGTPGYMSPEQSRGEPIDARSDIYSLGLMLRECLGESLEGDPSGTASSIHPDLRALSERCLREDRDERPSSAAEVRRVLDQALARGHLPDSIDPRTGAADVASTNLRFPANRFVGRAEELTRIEGLLEEHRIVTITGAGGCGKTRLAIEAARRLRAGFPDGVWFVDLGGVAPQSPPESAMEAVLPWKAGRRPGEERSLRDRISDRNALIILDNCEHLLSPCGTLLASLVEGTQFPRFLVTSREPLRIPGEAALRLAPLPVPASTRSYGLHEIQAFESVTLLLDRIRRIDPAFALDPAQIESILAICRGLDGLPLALELAAARIAALSPRDVADRLAKRLSIFRDPTRPREAHRTLQSLIDWSYGLLSAEEQGLLQALSLFPGGWSLAAAEAMASSAGIDGWRSFDVHAALLEKCLIESDPIDHAPEDPARFRMLETIRAYAAAKLLESPRAEEARGRQIDHYAGLAQTLDPHLTGPEQESWLRLLRKEQENLRAVLDCLEASPERVADGLRISAGLGRFWLLEGQWSQGLERLRRLLDAAGADTDPAVLAHASHWAANLAERTGALDLAESHARRSLAIWEDLGNRSDAARLLNNLGNIAYRRSDPKSAIAYYESALAIHRALGESLDLSHTLNNLGAVHASRGDFAAARAVLEESLAHKKRVEDHAGVGSTLQNLGALAGLQGDLPGAAAYLIEADRIYRRLRSRSSLSLVLGNLALVRRMQGDFDACRAHAIEGIEACADLDNPRGLRSLFEVLAMVAAQQGRHERAARLFGFVSGFGGEDLGMSAIEDADEVRAAVVGLRASLGEDAFAVSWAGGAAMTIDEAVALARGAD